MFIGLVAAAIVFFAIIRPRRRRQGMMQPQQHQLQLQGCPPRPAPPSAIHNSAFQQYPPQQGAHQGVHHEVDAWLGKHELDPSGEQPTGPYQQNVASATSKPFSPELDSKPGQTGVNVNLSGGEHGRQTVGNTAYEAP